MRYIFIFGTKKTGILIFTLVIGITNMTGIIAQPIDKQLWLNRCQGYALIWGGDPDHHISNPEFGIVANGKDCANFGSQILQAGCAGLCESNRLHPNETNKGAPQGEILGWGGVDYAVNCNAWYDETGDDDWCSAQGPENRLVIKEAKGLMFWLDAARNARITAEEAQLWPYSKVETYWPEGEPYQNNKHAWPPDAVGDPIELVPNWQDIVVNKGVDVGWICIGGYLKEEDIPKPENPEDETELPEYSDARWHWHVVYISFASNSGLMKYCAHDEWRVNAGLGGWFRQFNLSFHGWTKFFWWGGGLVTPSNLLNNCDEITSDAKFKPDDILEFKK